MSNFPLKKKAHESPGRNWTLAAFDFETTALDGDVVFGTFQYELEGPYSTRSAVQSVYTAAEMLDAMLDANQPGMRWYAHNLEFDLLFILKEARARQQDGELGDIQLFERGLGQFFKCIIHYSEYDITTGQPEPRTLEICDSLALFGFSLKIFAKNFSKIGQKFELDFDNESFDISNPRHIDYAKQDTAILFDSMYHFDNAIYDIFGVHCKGTISATALRAFENTIPENSTYFRMSPEQDEFCRTGYFGGLCFLTDTNEHADVESDDVNSMYPYCMRRFGVPAGRPMRARSIVSNKIGLYRVRCRAPASLRFGCIGYRDKQGICWPRGEFETTAFSFEIERALKWGYEVTILDGLVWPRIDFIFNDFVDLCESKRAAYKGSAFEVVVKLIQNSLYGKFGTKPDGKEVMMFADSESIDYAIWSPFINPESGACIIENCFEQTTERDAPYMQPHWAAYVTARARGVLLDAFELAPNDIFYGDTDSIKISAVAAFFLRDRGALNNGTAYGQFKIDGVYKRFRAIAPKVYVYEENAELHGKAKGIPAKNQNIELWQKLFVGDSLLVQYNSLGNLKSSLKSGGERKLNRHERATTDLKNSSSWWADENGHVKSVLISENRRIKA